MSFYKGQEHYRHTEQPAVGVLLVNLGTPDAPDSSALRRYLAEFLADPRVVEFPRWLWRVILHGVILRVRPRRSARAYRRVWTDQGSPLLLYSEKQLEALRDALKQHYPAPAHFVLGMRYGNPSIFDALEKLRQANVQKLLVLPLYPQYSGSTTGSTFDALSTELKHWRRIPELRFINNYHDFKPYIDAMARHIEAFWKNSGRAQRILFSFHGVPKRYLLKGDPYHCECHKTGRLLAEALGLGDDEWQVVFQSRFGREEWLQPYTDEVLKVLPERGIKHVQVFCPGFAADCLETLEEIAIESKEVFHEASGERFDYIPAMNAEPGHIEALASLIRQHTPGWEQPLNDDSKETQKRAMHLGARQ